MKDNYKYSVLMSVYKNDNPEWFKDSVISMINQTVTPQEIVIVSDGPLTEDLELAFDELISKYDCIKKIKLEVNQGLGEALNIGLENCRFDYVARMDADDYSIPTRLEKQLNFMNQNPEISVVGSHIREFDNDIKSEKNIFKRVPIGNKNIRKKIKFRNPVNHPSVLFRKKDIEKVGKYIEIKLNEDYFLWVRLINQGFKIDNINETLVYMRVNKESYLRRGGFRHFKDQNIIFKYMRKIRMINFFEYTYNVLVRFVVSVLFPNRIRVFFYKKVLRRK